MHGSWWNHALLFTVYFTVSYPIGSMVLLYMVTFTINISPILVYIPYMDPMGIELECYKAFLKDDTQSTKDNQYLSIFAWVGCTHEPDPHMLVSHTYASALGLPTRKDYTSAISHLQSENRLLSRLILAQSRLFNIQFLGWRGQWLRWSTWWLLNVIDRGQ